MRKPRSGYADRAIEQVLELSADAKITRRETGKDSPAFHRLTGAIVAYGKALALLTAVRHRQEFFTVIAGCEYSEGISLNSARRRSSTLTLETFT
jgi:hypothetical protein